MYFGATLYWVGAVMKTFGGLDWFVSALVALALVAYLSLYSALFAVVCSRLLSTFGIAALLVAPAVWVTAEFGRAYLLTGFPWVLLGYSQARVLQIAQIASLFGIFGLSALVSLVSTAVAYLVWPTVRPTYPAYEWSERRSGWSPPMAARVAVAAVAVGCVVASSLWGMARMRGDRLVHEGTPLAVGIVQGNVPQDEKWDTRRASEIFDRYLALTRDAARRGAKLIVWPESSPPFMFEEDAFGREAIRDVARQFSAYLLIGSDQVERAGVSAEGRTVAAKYYNAAFLVGPDGRTLATYRKMHLVPFGEYVPLKGLFFFANKLVEGVSDFSPGDQAVLLPVGRNAISTSICYEVVYPNLVRQFVLGGSQLLTTITNDAWYGYSSAPYQHFEQATLRAIEEGRYLVRSANTGISAIVDPYGRITTESALFQPAVLVGTVRALTGLTLYARIGDLVAYVAITITLVALAAAIVVGRRASGSKA